MAFITCMAFGSMVCIGRGTVGRCWICPHPKPLFLRSSIESVGTTMCHNDKDLQNRRQQGLDACTDFQSSRWSRGVWQTSTNITSKCHVIAAYCQAEGTLITSFYVWHAKLYQKHNFDVHGAVRANDIFAFVQCSLIRSPWRPTAYKYLLCVLTMTRG